MIFIDTSFWYAIRNPREGQHPTAVELMRKHGRASLVTTNHVRAETWTLMNSRAGHREAVYFLDRLERSPRLTVAWVDEQLEADAIVWLRRHDERPYSFVDATSFAVMRSLGVTEVLTFDSDFAAAGFTTLRA